MPAEQEQLAARVSAGARFLLEAATRRAPERRELKTSARVPEDDNGPDNAERKEVPDNEERVVPGFSFERQVRGEEGERVRGGDLERKRAKGMPDGAVPGGKPAEERNERLPPDDPAYAARKGVLRLNPPAAIAAPEVLPERRKDQGSHGRQSRSSAD